MLPSIATWAGGRDDIVGVAVVGSWARVTPRIDSDLDVVVLARAKGRYVTDDDWITSALGRGAKIVRTQTWGVVTERRVRLSSGLEVEFEFATTTSAVADPVDPGSPVSSGTVACRFWTSRR